MEEFLIEKVRQHEVLYDVKSCNYRDQNMRHEAWEEIGRDLKIKAETAKDTWDKLRRCFLNAMNRRRNKKSGQAAKKISPWKFEHQMAFLLPFVEIRKTHSNVEEGDTQDDSHYDETDDAQDYEKDKNEASEDLQQLDPDPQENTLLGKNKEIANHLENIKRKQQNTRNSNPMQDMVQIMKENSSLRKIKYQEKHAKEMDESDMFFLSMSKITKSLPSIEQAKIKLALSNAVFQAQIRLLEGEYHNNYCTTTPIAPQQPFSHPTSATCPSSESTSTTYSV